MKYRQFFLATDSPSTDSQEKFNINELKKGIAVELESTKDENLAVKMAKDNLREDSRFYSKLESFESSRQCPTISMPPSGVGSSPVGGIVTPQVIAVSMSGKSVGGEEGVHAPGDKSKITAAGKTDTGFAEKTVGGPSSPGEGQEQGGPNTKGSIAGTPNNSKIESQQDIAGESPTDQTIGVSEKSTPVNPVIASENKLKEAIKKEIKSVLKEMWMGWQHEGDAQYKVRDGETQAERPGIINRARDIQYEPTVNEDMPPDFPKDLHDKLKGQYKDNPEKAYATMWKLHNTGKVEEVQRRLAEMSSYKVNTRKPLYRTQDPMHARVVQTDPEVTETAYKVQNRSYRTFADSPQFPKSVDDPEVSENQYKVRDGKTLARTQDPMHARVVQTDPTVN